MSSPYDDEAHAYIIATYILAPMLFLVGLMVALYICCNKKYRLNWFERTLLDSSASNLDTSDETSHLREKPAVPRPGPLKQADDGGSLLAVVSSAGQDEDDFLGDFHYEFQQWPTKMSNGQERRSGNGSQVVKARVTPISADNIDSLTFCRSAESYLPQYQDSQQQQQQKQQVQQQKPQQQATHHWYPRQPPEPQPHAALPGKLTTKPRDLHQSQTKVGRRPHTQQAEKRSGLAPGDDRPSPAKSSGCKSPSKSPGVGTRLLPRADTLSTPSETNQQQQQASRSLFSFLFSSDPSGAHHGDNQGTANTFITSSSSSSAVPPGVPFSTGGSSQRGKYALLVSDNSLSSTVTSMGSLSSTPSLQGEVPSSRVSPRGSLTSEQFWVPPAVLQKKRAQSLIPSLLHHPDSDDSSSPSRTPTMSTSLQEMAFSFPTERLTETVSMVQGPAAASGSASGASHRTRRRASMQDALDATMINTSLYDAIQVPQPSQDFGSIQEEQLGSLHFSLDYNPEQGLLTVRLIQARDLVPRDFSGTADPYCRLCLLPQRRPQLQSRLHRKTVSPEFGEDFIFEVLPKEVDSRTLEILIYDYDQYSRDEPIGEIQLPLEEVDLSETAVLWKGISQPSRQAEMDESLGDLMVSMSYLASAERLTISILKARYLKPPEDGKNTANPFVKVQIVLGTKRLKKKKTSTKRNTLNPTWNEAVVFNLSKDLLPRVTLEFFVCSDNLLGSNETLGKMSLGPDASGDQLAHWKEMLATRGSNAMYHKLTPPPPNESPVYQNLGRRCSDFS